MCDNSLLYIVEHFLKLLPRSASLRFFEGGRVHFVQDPEFGDLLLEEPLAVALALDLRRLLDPAEVLVLAEGRLLSETVTLESGHRRHHFHRQAALLVEE